MRELQDSIDSFGNAGACILADNHAIHHDKEFLRDNLLFVFSQVCKRIADVICHGTRKALSQKYR